MPMPFIDDLGPTENGAGNEIEFQPGDALEMIFDGAEVVGEWSGTAYEQAELALENIAAELGGVGVSLSSQLAEMVQFEQEPEKETEVTVDKGEEPGPDTGGPGLDSLM